MQGMIVNSTGIDFDRNGIFYVNDDFSSGLWEEKEDKFQRNLKEFKLRGFEKTPPNSVHFVGREIWTTKAMTCQSEQNHGDIN